MANRRAGSHADFRPKLGHGRIEPRFRDKKKPPSKTWREAIPKTDYIFCSLGWKDASEPTCLAGRQKQNSTAIKHAVKDRWVSRLQATPPIYKNSEWNIGGKLFEKNGWEARTTIGCWNVFALQIGCRDSLLTKNGVADWLDVLSGFSSRFCVE